MSQLRRASTAQKCFNPNIGNWNLKNTIRRKIWGEKIIITLRPSTSFFVNPISQPVITLRLMTEFTWIRSLGLRLWVQRTSKNKTAKSIFLRSEEQSNQTMGKWLSLICSYDDVKNVGLMRIIFSPCAVWVRQFNRKVTIIMECQNI